MQYFRLLNQRALEKALLDLLTELARAKTLDSLPDLARSKLEDKRMVEFDGFDLFMPGAFIKPYQWFLSKPAVSITEALKIYERAVMQMGAGHETCGQTLGTIYARGKDERKQFDKLADGQRWSAFALFAACVQYLGTERFGDNQHKVYLRLGSGVVGFSNDGVWSNRMAREVRFPDNDMDLLFGAPITVFPHTQSSNSVLKALYELAGESNSRYAVTVAAHALQEGFVSEAFFNRIAKLDHELVAKARYVKRDPEKAAAALDRCLDLLGMGIYDIVPHLFEEAVPDLISYRKLQAIVGPPTRGKEGRRIREETLMNWQMKLENELERVRDAVT